MIFSPRRKISAVEYIEYESIRETCGKPSQRLGFVIRTVGTRVRKVRERPYVYSESPHRNYMYIYIHRTLNMPGEISNLLNIRSELQGTSSVCYWEFGSYSERLPGV